MKVFEEKELTKIYKPQNLDKGGNGQVTIIGGSSLFHGAPILSLKVASRIVDMVFFSSPEPSVGKVAEELKGKLNSFIWVPFEEVEEYLEKSDAALIGPGLMRYHKKIKNLDKTGEKTKEITEVLLAKFPQKQWVIDAGSLQVMDKEFIPQKAILTPNRKEFEMLFGDELMTLKSSTKNFDSVSDSLAKKRKLLKNSLWRSQNKNLPSAEPCFSNKNLPLAEPCFSKIRNETSQNLVDFSRQLQALASKYDCIIVFKNALTEIFSAQESRLIKGGNSGLVKGGTGDVLAGLTVALAAKNPPFWSACAASFLVKKAADELYQKVGFVYNADDLAEKIPEVLGKYSR